MNLERQIIPSMRCAKRLLAITCFKCLNAPGTAKSFRVGQRCQDEGQRNYSSVPGRPILHMFETVSTSLVADVISFKAAVQLLYMCWMAICMPCYS